MHTVGEQTEKHTADVAHARGVLDGMHDRIERAMLAGARVMARVHEADEARDEDECRLFAEDTTRAIGKAYRAHERRRRAVARKRPANVIDFATAAADVRLRRGSP